MSPVRDKISALRRLGKIQIVLDLHHVDYIDSTGLGNLVTQLHAGEEGRRRVLKLLNLNKRNVELLARRGCTPIFEVFGEETDAAQ